MEYVIVAAIFAGIIGIVIVAGKKGKGHGHRDRDYSSDSSDSWYSDGGSDSGCSSGCGGGGD